jgi:hypothetical protein
MSLPEGFEAQKPQSAEGRTKWTYLREGVAGHSDCRLRITVFEGSKPIPEDAVGANVALALLASYTSQQTKSLADLQFGTVSRVTMRDHVWWRVSWTGRNKNVSIAGLSYITTALDADYFLVFESLSPEEGSRLSAAIVDSFEPKKTANQLLRATDQDKSGGGEAGGER